MKIHILPSDIVKRCLWDSFSYYIIGSDKEAEKLLKEDKEFELSERDAIVVGLLKVMETDNLIHRFNDYMVHFLTIKSIKEKDDVIIRKKAVEISIDKFLDKFPDYWVPPINFANALKDLIQYIDTLRLEIEELESYEYTIQNIKQEFYISNSVKKLLNFNVF
jgi:hypothetical protein